MATATYHDEVTLHFTGSEVQTPRETTDGNPAQTDTEIGTFELISIEIFGRTFTEDSFIEIFGEKAFRVFANRSDLSWDFDNG